jgi:phage virion morphogenesis protein
MAGQDLTLELDPKDRDALQRLINDVKAGVSSMSPFFDAVEMHMIDSLTKNFEAGGRPKKWAPLAAATIRMKGSDGILQDTGRLKGSINSANTQKDDLSLKIWAGEKHGAFHQKAGDPDQWGQKNKRGMPFRPFLLFHDDDIREIESILGKYIDDVMGGGI